MLSLARSLGFITLCLLTLTPTLGDTVTTTIFLWVTPTGTGTTLGALTTTLLLGATVGTDTTGITRG